MTEQDDFDADVLLPEVGPYVLRAVDAAAHRDMDAVVAAWDSIVALGGRALFMAMTALSEMAVLAPKIPAGAIGPMPVIRWRPGGEPDDPGKPIDPDDPEHAAVSFVGRFCAAAVSKDRALQRDLMAAFAISPGADVPDAASEERMADAFAMLAQCAAEGLDRERARRARTHRHPPAPGRTPPQETPPTSAEPGHLLT